MYERKTNQRQPIEIVDKKLVRVAGFEPTTPTPQVAAISRRIKIYHNPRGGFHLDRSQICKGKLTAVKMSG